MKSNRRIIATSAICVVCAFALICIACIFCTVGCSSSISSTQGDKVRVESLKGPTSVGLAGMINDTQSANKYEFSTVAQADAIVADLAASKVDIALLPSTVAVNYYNKSDGLIKLIDINTLSAMYLVSKNADINGIADLKGTTLYMTGKGSIPEAVVGVLMQASGLSDNDVNIEFKSEAAEVLTCVAQNPGSVGLVNEPQATVGLKKNPDLHRSADLQKEWERTMGGSIVTGVTVVRSAYLQEHEGAVRQFLSDHATSVEYAGEHVQEALDVLSLNIDINDMLAASAVQGCNICCIIGSKAKETLQPFLQIICDNYPQLMTSGMPDDGFYSGL